MEENTQQQAADTTQAHDQADDWAGATADFLADKGVKTEEDKSNEQANGAENQQTTEGGEASQNNSENKEQDEKQGNGDDSEEGAGTEEKTDPNEDENLEQQDDSNAASREARQVQRQIQEDNKAMQADVRKELYPEWTDDILDGDGDPIKTPRDVMSHINPATGKRFTEEEATAWLFAAQKHKDGERAKMEERIEHVAEVMIDQRDQADQVKLKYGKLLAKLPELRKDIWADYKETLVIDKETGLIVDAPISLYKFFERALRPYEQYVNQIQSEATAKQNQQSDASRKQTQQDREDIHSSSGGTQADPEEDAWAKAAKEYYEG